MAGIDPALVVVGLISGSLAYILGYMMAKTYWYSRGHLDGTEDASKYLATRERVRKVEYRNVRVRENIEKTG
jgi:hypothetical protein